MRQNLAEHYYESHTAGFRGCRPADIVGSACEKFNPIDLLGGPAIRSASVYTNPPGINGKFRRTDFQKPSDKQIFVYREKINELRL